MKDAVKRIVMIFACCCLAMLFFSKAHTENQNHWHYSDGSPILCRVVHCENTPVYENWEDRFCREHLNRSSNHANEYSGSALTNKTNTNRAMTKEEANALKGTGYHGTRPNSPAEIMEIEATQVKCKRCGKHTRNGRNSLCDSCKSKTYTN